MCRNVAEATFDSTKGGDMEGEWTGEFAVETTGLTKRFGTRTVVDHVDLHVPRGSAFGYLGPNGAGKTTTIRMLLGLTAANDGEMRLLGRAVPAERSTVLVRVGAIVEEPKFLDYLTGRENLRIIAAVREPEAHGRIDGVLERVGLRDRADDRVGRYSTGMRQRLGVARCLLADPDLLILDEPANGLDPAGIQEFRLMVRALVDEGRTVMLSSHLLDEVEKVCDTVAIVDRGRVVAQGSITELSADGVQSVVLRASDPGRAMSLLSGHPALHSVEENGTDLRAVLGQVSPHEARSVAADLNRRLVEEGVEVFEMELPRVTLEERFLEITNKMQEGVPA
jgi:ABC-2 type transport system ATP-binding protein